jgi:ATP-binding cassette, subfamily B, bacterial
MRCFKYSVVSLSKAFHNYINTKFKFININVISNNLLAFVYFIPSFFLLFIGGIAAIHGEMTIGGIFALSSYISSVFSPIKSLTNINIDMQSSLASLKRYFEIININENESDKRKNKINKINSGISIKNVSFSYDGKNELFNNYSNFIPKGSLVKLVGCNGSGKSTFIDLITGIITPTKGEIRYDNFEINTISDSALRKLIGIIPQNINLFNDSIRNNIKMGRNVSDDNIINLSYELKFTDIINSSEINLNTIIENFGGNLSGGQQQKISILRALAGSPSILIFDEATTFLDNDSKNALNEYICHVSKNVIVFYITHDNNSNVKSNFTIDFNPTGLKETSQNVQNITEFGKAQK